eukprot:g81560.t1
MIFELVELILPRLVILVLEPANVRQFRGALLRFPSLSSGCPFVLCAGLLAHLINLATLANPKLHGCY